MELCALLLQKRNVRHYNRGWWLIYHLSSFNKVYNILTTIISEGSRTKHSFCLRALPPVRFPKLKIIKKNCIKFNENFYIIPPNPLQVSSFPAFPVYVSGSPITTHAGNDDTICFTKFMPSLLATCRDFAMNKLCRWWSQIGKRYWIACIFLIF